MFYRIDILLRSIDRLVLRAWVAAMCLSLLCGQTPLFAQAPCADYDQCPALQGETNRKLNGPITFSFNQASLDQRFPNPDDRTDFINRMRAAAADWATNTGISISEAPAGQTGNVTIQVEPSESAPGVPTETGNQNGYVDFNPPGDTSSPSRTLGMSDEWSTWSGAGKKTVQNRSYKRFLSLESL